MAFEIKTLGRGVVLGELYDAHSSQFLGIQLCDSAVVKQYTETTKEPNTKFSVKQLDNTVTKSDVLDISAEVSAEILSGMITVNGSASYISDVKSNSKETTWALSLISTVNATSFSNIDKIIEKANAFVVSDFKKHATHFVIKAVYGGDIICNLVADEQTKEDGQEITGKLHAKLDKLPGAISIEGEIDAKVKEEYKDADERLDVTMHADVALDKLPVNLFGVFEILPDAIKAISKNPIPVTVYLQPLPQSLFDDAGVIHNLEADIRATILEIYRDLQDIQSRYSVLQGSCAQYKDIIPALIAEVNSFTITFLAENARLSEGLGDYLRDFKSRGTAVYPEATVKEARAEISKQTQPSKEPIGKPKCLADLEISYTNFVLIVLGLKSTSGSRLTPLPGLRKEVINRPEAALVIMPPLPPKPVPRDYSVFMSLVKKARLHFTTQIPPVNAYFYYAESLANLEAVLPSGDKFKNLKVPTAFLGQKKLGKITWSQVTLQTDPTPEIYDVRPCYYQHYENDDDSYLQFNVNVAKLDATKSFTLVLEAMYRPSEIQKYRVMATLSAGHLDFVFCFRSELWGEVNVPYLDVLIKDQKASTENWIVGGGSAPKTLFKNFHCALVQDLSVNPQAWILYYNGEEVGQFAIPKGVDLASSARLESPKIHRPPRDKAELLEGTIHDVRVYDKALDFLQIVTEYQEVIKNPNIPS